MIYTSIDDYDDVRVVKLLVDEIMFNNYEEILGKVKSAISDEYNMIVLDMEKVSFMDSLSLGMLVPLLLYTKRLGGAMKIARPNDTIKKLFGILQIDKILEVYDSVDGAVESF